VATLNLSSVLEHRARLTPDRVAIVCGTQQLTYGALDAQARRVAAGLHATGIRAGDHVALACPNLPYFPIAYFGILKAGAAVVPINVLLKAREIAFPTMLACVSSAPFGWPVVPDVYRMTAVSCGSRRGG